MSSWQFPDMRRLAKQLGLTQSALAETDEQIAASTLPKGVTLDDLRVHGWLKMGPPRPTLEGRKLRIAEEVVAPAAPRRPAMLQLLTPKSHYFLNSTFANMKRQRHANGLPTLSIHPGDAAHAGLADEDEVQIYNDLGTLHARAAITDDILRGVVSLPGKWWHPAPSDERGAVSNLLSGSDWSPGGQPACNEVFVEVRRAKSSA